MSSIPTIANLAATKVGADAHITSLDDDRHVARTIKSVWDIERRATIRDGAYNFAMRRFALAAETLGDRVIYPWLSSFPIPGDMLRLIEVISPEVGEDYQLEGRSILCNISGPLYIRGLIDVTEPGNWDEAFAKAFACRIAWSIGKRIAGSSFSQNEAWQEYEQALNDAKRVDARENPGIGQAESGWVEARYSSRGGRQ